MHHKGASYHKLSRKLSLTRRNMIVRALLGTILLVLSANTFYGASI